MTIELPVLLYGQREILTVEYEPNDGPVRSGFDLLDVPFPKEACLGYPTLHAYFSKMQQTGYKRYCGFLQLVERTEDGKRQTLSIDVDPFSRQIGNPYFSYGYPASLYDAPCKNLGNAEELVWKAYTYLVEMPGRLNQNNLRFLAGFSWGYVENTEGVQSLLDFCPLTALDFSNHLCWMHTEHPQFVTGAWE